MGLHLALIGTFFPALLQPLLDGGLFLRLPLSGALMFPLVAGKSEIASARKTALFLLHGMIAEGKTPTPCSERKPQRKKTQIFHPNHGT